MRARGLSTLELVLVPVLCASLATGCYSNSVITQSDLSGLRRANQHRELVLESADGERTRIGPNSEIRFLRRDGVWTAWVPASELCVTDATVALCGTAAGRQRPLRWRSVQGIEVKNFDGLTTYAAVLGTAIIVAVVVLMIAGGGKGGGGGGGGLGGIGHAAGGAARGVGHGVAHGAGHAVRAGAQAGRAFAQAVDAAARVSYSILDANARGWAWYGPELQFEEVEPAPPPVPPAAPSAYAPLPPLPPPPPAVYGGEVPPPPPSVYGDAPAPAPPIVPAAVAPPAPLPPLVASTPPAPLFSPLALRRSSVRLVGAVEGGTDFSLGAGGTMAALVGLRLSDVVELGGGARMIATPEQPGVAGSPVRARWLAVGRFLLHCDVDSHRRVALPIGVDAGAGQAELHVRAVLGVRVRLWEDLWLGVYPYNPTYTSFADGLGYRSSAGWFTFPTTAEVSFAF
jgi:hypothetical protein